MTWVPNELEGAILILFEFLDVLMEPKGEIQHISTFISQYTFTHVCPLLSFSVQAGYWSYGSVSVAEEWSCSQPVSAGAQTSPGAHYGVNARVTV